MASKRKLKPEHRGLARIHCLAKELGLDRDQYEAVLWTVGRVHSSKELDAHGRKLVIDHLQSHVNARTRRASLYPSRPHNADTEKRAELKKIEALLADADKPWAYALGIAERMYGKERLEFCSNAQLAGVISALHGQALKRLHAELEQVLGQEWAQTLAVAAALLFGFDGWHRDVTRYPEAMSLVLRWYRGEVAPSCAWPVQLLEEQPACCRGCLARAQGRP